MIELKDLKAKSWRMSVGWRKEEGSGPGEEDLDFALLRREISRMPRPRALPRDIAQHHNSVSIPQFLLYMILLIFSFVYELRFYDVALQCSSDMSRLCNSALPRELCDQALSRRKPNIVIFHSICIETP